MNRTASDGTTTRRFMTAGPAAVIHADLDGDGTLDIALLDATAGRVLVFVGDDRAGYSATGGASTRIAGPVEHLTRRETEVAALIASGYTDAEIARILGIGRRTAETHASRVLGKLGLRSRRELIRRTAAARAG